VREWATEIPLKSLKRPGVALVDQIRSWSFVVREVNFRGETVTAEELNAAKYAIRSFLQL
jgi:mRNA interferase MazF